MEREKQLVQLTRKIINCPVSSWKYLSGLNSTEHPLTQRGCEHQYFRCTREKGSMSMNIGMLYTVEKGSNLNL